MTEFDNTQTTPWPYPTNYGKENEVTADVIILGGGIAGCHAAVHAARRGAKVVIVDKGPVIRSGSGGAGVDHWHAACTNPCSNVTPDEMMEAVRVFGDYSYGEFGNGITCYIQCKESYDALMDVEKMGVKVRDVDDEFVGAEFRDEKTKLMFAYDYENRTCIRVNGGAHIKVALYNELRRLGVQIYDRIMVTSLLTEGADLRPHHGNQFAYRRRETRGAPGRCHRIQRPHRGVLHFQCQGCDPFHVCVCRAMGFLH